MMQRLLIIDISLLLGPSNEKRYASNSLRQIMDSGLIHHPSKWLEDHHKGYLFKGFTILSHVFIVFKFSMSQPFLYQYDVAASLFKTDCFLINNLLIQKFFYSD